MTAALPARSIARNEHVFLVTKLIRVGRRPILRDSEARYLLRDVLIFYKTKHSFRLYGFCFLPDRVHLVVGVTHEDDLKTALYDVWRLARLKVKQRFGLRGLVFRPMYLAEPLPDPPAVRRALVYIHDQPTLRRITETACHAPITSAAAYRKGLGDRLVELYTRHQEPREEEPRS